MFGLQKEEYQCCICGNTLTSMDEFYKIKKRYLFPDKEGTWHAEGNVYLCMDCAAAMRSVLKRN
jgi:5-methylcytosine-specific restriction endonuclease McrA